MQIAKLGQAIIALFLSAAIAGCGEQAATPPTSSQDSEIQYRAIAESVDRFDIYAPVELRADLSGLSNGQRKMIGVLIRASAIMDDLFWRQAFGDWRAFLAAVQPGPAREFAEINYGPWDRLDGDAVFLEGFDAKAAGANFYPADMSREEFEGATMADKEGLYSLVRRNADGQLYTVPYHEVYADELAAAAKLLLEASKYAEDEGFKNYLRLRADALTTDDYQPSDMAWLDMKNNEIDLVIGAIETYEDQLFNYRAGYEAYVLLKDMAWSEQLQRFAAFLPDLQRALPVSDEYKAESPGSDSDLNAYDVIYYAGHSNSGSKTIAINLPNDEEVQLAKGTRRLQLKNAMQAKFDEILVPISKVLIDPEQQQHISFDAFFSNTMFHEVAHGLGIKNTINDSGTVRNALRELASATEEGKADVLGLWMITWLSDNGELPAEKLMNHYTTFLAGIFRSVRFGASSAHGRANMVRFNFFDQAGAFDRSDEGYYSVNFNVMRQAVDALSRRILTLQGDGDYDATKQLMDAIGVVPDALQSDLARLNAAGIPVDIVFEQGKDVLGL
ncbi:MAG: Zn-dependent hydrolase [Gammaproteobacteria bacterium]|nr:Zn-dependent hydrolase [Gammaproteobacteria bacterium]MDH3768688.1 Zn-dependent hydrolase [Gammaproteobacteria bacterium]